jgi:Uncharacterised nucleotidyltransferase
VQLLQGLIELTQGRPFEIDPNLVPELVDLAVEHRVVPLLLPLFLKLEGVDKDRLVAIDLLMRHRFRSAQAELKRVVEAAESVGVQIAVLKGTAHAERWFSADPAVRQFSDLDLFVDPRNSRYLDILLHALDPNHELTGHASELMSVGVLPDIPVRSGAMLIELHANPLSLYLPASKIATLWSATEPWISSDGLELRRLNSTMALLHALINSAKDNHAFLLQVVEIGRAIEDPSIDWVLLHQTVTDMRWDTLVDDAIRYVCSALAIPLPALHFRPNRRDKLILDRLTPPLERLGGRATWVRAQRFAKPDLTVPGQRVRAVTGILSRTMSPDVVIRAYAPDLTGPYLVRSVRYWIRRQQYVQGKRSSMAD